METGLRNQSTKVVGQKTGAARNRAPIIQRALVLIRTHLSMRLILVEITTKGVINHESATLGWRRASPNFSALNIGVRCRKIAIALTDQSQDLVSTVII